MTTLDVIWWMLTLILALALFPIVVDWVVETTARLYGYLIRIFK